MPVWIRCLNMSAFFCLRKISLFSRLKEIEERLQGLKASTIAKTPVLKFKVCMSRFSLTVPLTLKTHLQFELFYFLFFSTSLNVGRIAWMCVNVQKHITLLMYYYLSQIYVFLCKYIIQCVNCYHTTHTWEDKSHLTNYTSHTPWKVVLLLCWLLHLPWGLLLTHHTSESVEWISSSSGFSLKITQAWQVGQVTSSLYF